MSYTLTRYHDHNERRKWPQLIETLEAGDDVAVCNLEQQRRFFRTHIQTWVEQLCDTVLANPQAQVWRALAGFTQQFVRVETQGFDMLEA